MEKKDCGENALLLRWQHRSRSTKLLISSSASARSPPLPAASFYLHPLSPASSPLLSLPFSSRALLCIYFINPTLLSLFLHACSPFISFTLHFLTLSCSPFSKHSSQPLSVFVSIMTCFSHFNPPTHLLPCPYISASLFFLTSSVHCIIWFFSIFCRLFFFPFDPFIPAPFSVIFVPMK